MSVPSSITIPSATTTNNAGTPVSPLSTRTLFPTFGLPLLCSPQYKKSPAHLPDAVANGLLAFDVEQKKREIFEQAREAIRNSAEYSKQGGKQPWRQITVRLPVIRNKEESTTTTTTPEEDLAVVWALMRNSTRDAIKENDTSLTWNMLGHRAFLEWLGIDVDKTKPVDKYVHPVKLIKSTEEVEEKRVSENELTDDEKYHWATYERCCVIYKKRQTRKKNFGQLTLTIKIRTSYLGNGDPTKHGGLMNYSSGLDDMRDMDPTSDHYISQKQMNDYFAKELDEGFRQVKQRREALLGYVR